MINTAYLENFKLEAPSELHAIQVAEFPELIQRLDAKGINLLLYVDSKTKKEKDSHQKIKEQCKNLRIQHIMYKTLCKKAAADNIRRAIAASLQKMGYETVIQD